MTNYISLVRKFSISRSVVACMDGKIVPPEFTYDVPPVSYGFPPVVIPIWSNSGWPGCIGIMKHWFGDDQSPTYVQYFAEGSQLVEVAKNALQLAAWLTFEFLANVPEPDEVGEFAKAMGLCESDEVEEFFEVVDEAEDLIKLDLFRIDPPSFFVGGERPMGWVGSCDHGTLQRALDTADWATVWFLINSPGWEPSLVSGVLEKLESVVRNEDFGALVQLWRTQNC